MDRLSRLDGLRGVLAAYIVFVHALPFTSLPARFTGRLDHGEAAVDLFFALSGLVIFNSLERFDYRFWPFLQGRAWRLLPVYLAVLAMAVLLLCAGTPLKSMPWIAPQSSAALFWTAPPSFLWHVIAHATLMHGLIPQGMLPWAWITVLGPAWSLSTEWQFYVVMGVILPRMKGSRRLTHFAYLMLCVGVFYHVVAPHFSPYWQFSRAFLPDAAPYFALGLAAAVWMRNRNPIPYLACLAGVLALELFSGVPSKALIPIGWTVVLLAQRNPRMPVLPNLLGSRVAQYLGAISYPLYLINEPMQRACAMLIAPFTGGSALLFNLFWLPAALGAPILGAIALHRWVEAPAMRAKQVGLRAPGWLLRSRPIAGPAAGVPQPPAV